MDLERKRNGSMSGDMAGYVPAVLLCREVVVVVVVKGVYKVAVEAKSSREIFS